VASQTDESISLFTNMIDPEAEQFPDNVLLLPHLHVERDHEALKAASVVGLEVEVAEEPEM
jgi:hypothetical protein